MPNLNQVNLIGHITRDVDTRYTPSGTAVVEVGLAINRAWKSDSGEKKEEVTFVDVTLFGRVGEVVSQYVKKGDPLFVSGRLHLDSWTDKQTNQPRNKLKIIGEQIQLLGSRQQAPAPAKPAPAARPAPVPASAPRSRPHDPDLDAAQDDAPF